MRHNNSVIDILCVFGTRPEAIKLCPLVKYLRGHSGKFLVKVCVTGQHRGMLDQVLEAFHVRPDYDLNVMEPGQTLASLTSKILSSLPPVMNMARPDVVVVQGDTTTTLAGSLAAYYQGVKVAHVEAGLRTGDFMQPFPEEMNRVLTARIASLHFAPTSTARANLIAESVPADQIFVTGNTGIDAVLHVRDGLASGDLRSEGVLHLDPNKQTILVTSHRRENFGGGLERIIRAVGRLAQRSDVQIVFPVHRNPNVLGPVHEYLSPHKNVFLIEPLSYVPFVDMMNRSTLIISDSGGVQEEAPSLGKPVLLLREKTERPEAVEAGTVELVGTDEDLIFQRASLLLDSSSERDRMARVHNPYGDGHACERIADVLAAHVQIQRSPAV